ncbi:MAG: UDP-N-acetylglucosamine 1-carboxyvinyltransferase [Finegoldia sp.]|nr:UDP-N-acetylglucosamine 1-carboxyvinyltransferase [Finegoldia sp.]
MEIIEVKESNPLRGEVRIDGAKNSALPILAACLLGTEPIVLEEVPQLEDVRVIIKVLESLGAKINFLDENTVEIDSSKIDKVTAPSDLMAKMRASFLVMGPLLTRMGKTRTYMPGGCAIGARPIDLHLKGFEALGAKIESSDDKVEAIAEDGLTGTDVYLDFPSVGATQNIMMAATLAKGETNIENAAKEPEIVDLANFLNKMGADIKGAGTSTIRVRGVEKLKGCRHTIIPDRIEAATFMVAAAMTRGDVVIKNCISSHIIPVIAKLREAACSVIEDENEDTVRVIGPKGALKATKIRTLPYPGFPTDVQAQFMALMTICKGTSSVEETVFENRFMHVDQLKKMGAAIATEGNEANIVGVEKLHGARVKSTDLRAGAALIMAGLVADGTTQVTDIYHIDRGYHDIVGKFKKLGANIERKEVED